MEQRFAERRLAGFATDGVATVEALDGDGNVLDSAPVVHNLFASETMLGGRRGGIRTLAADGTVLTPQQRPGR